MSLSKILIANRGEIAIRIARSAVESGVASHAIYSEDDTRSDHVNKVRRACGPRHLLYNTQHRARCSRFCRYRNGR